MSEMHDQDQKKADVDAIQKGLCPECKEDLSADAGPEAHAEHHWPTRTTKPDSDAARRKKLITNYASRRKNSEQGS